MSDIIDWKMRRIVYHRQLDFSYNSRRDNYVIYVDAKTRVVVMAAVYYINYLVYLEKEVINMNFLIFGVGVTFRYLNHDTNEGYDDCYEIIEQEEWLDVKWMRFVFEIIVK